MFDTYSINRRDQTKGIQMQESKSFKQLSENPLHVIFIRQGPISYTDLYKTSLRTETCLQYFEN